MSTSAPSSANIVYPRQIESVVEGAARTAYGEPREVR